MMHIICKEMDSERGQSRSDLPSMHAVLVFQAEILKHAFAFAKCFNLTAAALDSRRTMTRGLVYGMEVSPPRKGVRVSLRVVTREIDIVPSMSFNGVGERKFTGIHQRPHISRYVVTHQSPPN